MPTRLLICTPVWIWRSFISVTAAKPALIDTIIRHGKPLVFLLGLVPLTILVFEALGVAGMSLGANAIEELLHRCGKWGLNFLMFTLMVTPLRRMTGWNGLIRWRRMLGLFAFFYICLHFTVYLVLDQTLDFEFILEDIAERPYITLGFTAFLMLISLAITSTNKMMRRLGKRWIKLHRLVYVIATLGVIHFFWQVKTDEIEPLYYVTVLAFLLGYRIWYARRRRQKS